MTHEVPMLICLWQLSCVAGLLAHELVYRVAVMRQLYTIKKKRSSERFHCSQSEQSQLVFFSSRLSSLILKDNQAERRSEYQYQRRKQLDKKRQSCRHVYHQ